MNSKWMLSNFKSVRNAPELGFAPITLFVGQNSAGKSTVLQSILLTTVSGVGFYLYGCDEKKPSIERTRRIVKRLRKAA